MSFTLTMPHHNIEQSQPFDLQTINDCNVDRDIDIDDYQVQETPRINFGLNRYESNYSIITLPSRTRYEESALSSKNTHKFELEK